VHGQQASVWKTRGHHGCPRCRAPRCGSLKASRSPLGTRVPRGERRAAGPRNDSGGHIRDKSLQSKTVIPVGESRISRQTPCKPTSSNLRWRSLHTREVAGSNPAVPMKKPRKSIALCVSEGSSTAKTGPQAGPRTRLVDQSTRTHVAIRTRCRENASSPRIDARKSRESSLTAQRAATPAHDRHGFRHRGGLPLQQLPVAPPSWWPSLEPAQLAYFLTDLAEVRTERCISNGRSVDACQA
jgi:hypothetical protein